ncbi:helix-turn-helix transcriptional regulator [Lactococcus taiwanensis]|uniref:Helix-turn-helix transcriptional regulator n=2 Tax=Lactococcus taiwanensis TaxID=1151742 RepID=A0AA45KG34_9LACT|nr:helix-turn-helix transcriptional regulator [Lactococcus taiwanensis]
MNICVCPIPLQIIELSCSNEIGLIGGKYKMLILYALSMHEKPIRYNELKSKIGNISFKTLTNTLRELENVDLINRKEFPQVPPKVEYGLTNLGLSIILIFDALCYWGEEQLDKE